MQEETVASGQLHHAEMRDLYLGLPVVEGESFEWIATDWLQQWLKSSAKDNVPPFNNNSLLCRHYW